MINIEETRETIISFIENNGPSLPVKIAKEIKMDPMFASAILSELTSAHQIKTSKMKVGASQIFFLEGQENKLERFAQEYLKGPEKQAFLKLRQEKYLIDINQSPAIRVALRIIKDFATPFKHNEQIMWRYNFYPLEELSKLLSRIPKKDTSLTKRILLDENKQKSLFEKSQSIIGKSREQEPETREQEPETREFESQKPHSSISPSTPPSTPKSSFSIEVKEFLKNKEIKIDEVLSIARNEFIAKIVINSTLGKTNYLLIAKNKKSITFSEILAFFQQATEQKMPCYLLHTGKLSKKTLESLEPYKNLIKVDKL